jgi:predicted dehydrogenase
MSRSRCKSATSRRRFLKQGVAAAATVGFPHIIPGSALGLDGATAPSNRIAVGFIGMGKMARGHLGSFRQDRGVQVVGICDVEQGRREEQAHLTNDYYKKRDSAAGQGTAQGTCSTHVDFRELCARPDVDGVIIATPNHWHALNAVEAAKNGKDIYLEKPLARTIGEGQAIVRAVRRYGRILQVGSMQRSDTTFHHACELVRNGRIGKVHTVNVNVGGPPEASDSLPEEPIPEGLDWDRWLGPAPWRPFSSVLCPPTTWDGWARWRYYRDYAGGKMTDFGAHHFDIAQWGLGMDHTGPVEVIPPREGGEERLVYIYANGIRMYHGGAGGSGRGAAVEWIGDEGIVRVNRGQYLETVPDSVKLDIIGPSEDRLYRSRNHKDNWLKGIRTRKPCICTSEIGHHTANVCHIGNIAYWLKRPLKWDPDGEFFVDDPEANRLLNRPMREPWALS